MGAMNPVPTRLRYIVGGEVPPEQPEDVVGEAAGFAAVNLRDIDDGTPSRTTDSVSATAGTPARSMQGLFDGFSQRIVPSWLGWPRGAVRSDPVALSHTQQHSRGGPDPLSLRTGSLTVRTFSYLRGCMRRPGM